MMTLRKYSLMTLGSLAFAAGAVGLFVPLLPTTVFWLVAAWCFARSHSGWRDRLYSHPRFGRVLSDLLEDGTATQAVKKAAMAGMASGFLLSAILIGARPYVLGALALVLTAVGYWVANRPDPNRGEAVGRVSTKIGAAKRSGFQ